MPLHLDYCLRGKMISPRGIYFPDKSCEFCEIPLKRQSYPTGWETLARYMQRRFCSLHCSESKKSPLGKTGYSWRARHYLKERCEVCGSKKKLTAHHVNKNRADNTPENIQTLCHHCHAFWHTSQKRLDIVILTRMPPLFEQNGNLKI